MKKWKNPIIWQCVAILLVAVMIVLEILILTVDVPKKALKANNFENVKVSIYQQVAFLSSDDNEEEGKIETSQTNVEEDAGVDTAREWPELSGKEKIGEIIVAGNSICSQDDFGKCYYLTEDDRNYEIRFVEDDLWDDSDLGKWYKNEIQSIKGKTLFDFETIIGLTKKDFEKQEDFYTIKKEKQEFYEILQIGQTQSYVCDYLRFYFTDGKLSYIKLAFYYQESHYYAYEYRFDYGNYEVELPQIEE